jgi:hypothetical protein
MNTFSKKSIRCRLVLLAASALGGVLFAQSPQISPSTSASADIFIQYQEEQWTLALDLEALLFQGASQAQVESWQQQNAPQIAAQQQLAQALANSAFLQPMPALQSVTALGSGSGPLGDFLTTQASLGNDRALIHNQLLQAMPANPSQQDVDSMEQQEEQTFDQQYSGYLQLQAQQAQSLGEASASVALPVPGPAIIPSGATSQFQAYLTLRNALAAAQAQLWNQYLTADPETRDAAIQQWTEQNAASFQQLTQLAQALANPTQNQEVNNQ